jgi:putrescine transport system ATP-binding protein
VWVALRPEKLRVASAQPGVSENCVAGRVTEIAYLGNFSVYKVRLDNGFIIKAQLPNLTRVVERPIGANDRVWLAWTPDAGVVLTG